MLYVIEPPNVKHYFDGFEKDTLKWNQNLTYESMLRTQKKKSSLLHNTKQGKNKHMVRKIKRCNKSLYKTRKELIKEDVKQNVVNGKTNMMVWNISRSYEVSAKWKQHLSKDYDVSTIKMWI